MVFCTEIDNERGSNNGAALARNPSKMPFLPRCVPEPGNDPGSHQVASSARVALMASMLPRDSASTNPKTTCLFSAAPITILLVFFRHFRLLLAPSTWQAHVRRAQAICHT